MRRSALLIATCVLSSLAFIGCSGNKPASCLKPSSRFEEKVERAVPSFQNLTFRGFSASGKIENDIGFGKPVYVITAWPDKGDGQEPDFVDVAAWVSKTIDGSQEIYAADAVSRLYTPGFDSIDIALQIDLIDSNILNKPINCSLHELKKDE